MPERRASGQHSGRSVWAIVRSSERSAEALVRSPPVSFLEPGVHGLPAQRRRSLRRRLPSSLRDRQPSLRSRPAGRSAAWSRQRGGSIRFSCPGVGAGRTASSPWVKASVPPPGPRRPWPQRSLHSPAASQPERVRWTIRPPRPSAPGVLRSSFACPRAATGPCRVPVSARSATHRHRPLAHRPRPAQACLSTCVWRAASASQSPWRRPLHPTRPAESDRCASGSPCGDDGGVFRMRCSSSAKHRAKPPARRLSRREQVESAGLSSPPPWSSATR